jgi:hypothetical protein
MLEVKVGKIQAENEKSNNQQAFLSSPPLFISWAVYEHYTHRYSVSEYSIGSSK